MQAPQHNSLYGSTAKEPSARVPDDVEPQWEGELPPDQLRHVTTNKGIFSSGARLRMNIIPCFFNIFMPWGVFLFCASVLSSHLRYKAPQMAGALMLPALIFGCCVTGLAVWARRREPNPTWFTFSSFAVWIAIVVGTYFGMWNYEHFYRGAFEMHDLKVIPHLDAFQDRGQNVMDGGIFYFAAGNHLDHKYSWHFTHGTTYCVTPITGPEGETPKFGFYDFWAVGKDCCSTQAADFRCGEYADPHARSGYRILDEQDQAFYKLAVEQTETNYGIRSAFPIFVSWDVDPLETVSWWETVGDQNYHCAVWGFLCWSVMTTAFATFKFAWIGRVYEIDVNGVRLDDKLSWMFNYA